MELIGKIIQVAFLGPKNPRYDTLTVAIRAMVLGAAFGFCMGHSTHYTAETLEALWLIAFWAVAFTTAYLASVWFSKSSFSVRSWIWLLTHRKGR